jgi:glycosyltransferase involved in cell wall biosynthesis
LDIGWPLCVVAAVGNPGERRFRRARRHAAAATVNRAVIANLKPSGHCNASGALYLTLDKDAPRRPCTQYGGLCAVKITFLSMNADLTGGSRMIAGHAQRLRSRGHEVTVVVKRSRSPGWHQRLHRIRAFASLNSPSAKRTSHFDGLNLDMRLSKRTDCITASDVPDADVVVATWRGTAEWAQRLPRAKGVRACFVQAHAVFDHLPVKRVRATYRAPLYMMSVSAWLRREIKGESSDHEIDRALNAVDPEVFNAPERGRQARPTGRFVFARTPWKRVDLILQALSRLLPGFISYTDTPSQHQIADTYRRCDAWVTASVNEGFGLPALEAMACRTPVVATRSGWPADAIQSGFNGYLAEENNIGTLLTGRRQALTLPETQWR